VKTINYQQVSQNHHANSNEKRLPTISFSVAKRREDVHGTELDQQSSARR